MKKIQILHLDNDELSLFLVKSVIPTLIQANSNVEFNSLDCPIKCLSLINFKYLKVDKIVLFCDLQLPNISGWDFIELVKDIDLLNKIDIYVITEFVFDQESGFDKYSPYLKGYHKKPLDFVILKNLLLEYI